MRSTSAAVSPHTPRATPTKEPRGGAVPPAGVMTMVPFTALYEAGRARDIDRNGQLVPLSNGDSGHEGRLSEFCAAF